MSRKLRKKRKVTTKPRPPFVDSQDPSRHDVDITARLSPLSPRCEVNESYGPMTDPNAQAREDVPFPNPLAPRIPPPQFNPRSELAINPGPPSPHDDGTPMAPLPSTPSAAPAMTLPTVEQMQQFMAMFAAMQPQVTPPPGLTASIAPTPAPAPAAVEQRPVANAATLLQLLKAARVMPYERMIDAAELVVKLADGLSRQSAAEGHPVTFNEALLSIHKISGLLANDPSSFAQVVTAF
jgi:hypothetical protein